MTTPASAGATAPVPVPAAAPGPAPEAKKGTAIRPGIWNPDTGRPHNEPTREAPPLPLAVDAFEAARMLGVDHKTLRREIDRGRLRGFKVGRLLRIQTAELLAYIRRQEKA
jgi:excisionase family DNA binding protein